ncbi:periplasmic heavy metal sensor [Azospirillum sp. RWY-5-1]|uniref:Periplasmic heavy metal sensor n=1 Tax=Azospirillum oleiclasticum TaxID=2735135 RepID=A0ABX2TFI6_9PROT|nr:periplasmic heavy metal sensor [Azospirillum oleiclasticum]NYZ17192.1 periplasmic heavy metal sensor [Azospirillum oleiclasticum]NYZ23099.1 periplasmic heavy metal sensor [Azospirillum oleiclasticum]
MTALLQRPVQWLRLLALASLALNLFLGAMLIADRHHGPTLPEGPLVERVLARANRVLPEEDAQRMRDAFAVRDARFAALQTGLETASRRVRALVGAERIDVGALRQAVDEARASRRLIGDLIEDTVLATIPDLSVDGRRRLAAAGGG